MPNPLSRVVKGRPFFFLSFDALFDEPELALEVMAVINTWAYCEFEMAHWLAELLRTDSRVAYGMLNALSGGEARRAVLDGAAKTALSKGDFALYESVERQVRASRRLRNRFAHGLWGTLPIELPQHLLLIQPEDLTDNIIDWSKRKSAPEAYPKLDYSKVEVYAAAELENARLDAEAALVLTRGLVWACTRRKTSLRAQRRRELSGFLAESPSERRKSLRRKDLTPQRRFGVRPQET